MFLNRLLGTFYCFDTLEEGIDYRIAGELKNTDKIMTDSFWIGVYPGMKKEQLNYMVKIIQEFVLLIK